MRDQTILLVAFFKKRYQEDGLVAHARLNDGSILIFRGKDQKGHMALLRLSNPQPNDKNNEDLKISLSLSYIENPGKPDAYRLKDGDFWGGSKVKRNGGVQIKDGEHYHDIGLRFRPSKTEYLQQLLELIKT